LGAPLDLRPSGGPPPGSRYRARYLARVARSALRRAGAARLTLRPPWRGGVTPP